MYYTQEELKRAIQILFEKYPDKKINTNKVIGSDNDILSCSVKYIEKSMKRSNFKNICFENSRFENVALTGSSFDTVWLENCFLVGSSFAACDFYKTSFKSNSEIQFIGNNFSQTSFTNCILKNTIFKGSGFLQTLFHKCSIKNTDFRSSTFEGSRFINCEIIETDFSNTNVEFIELIHTRFYQVAFPFYQFAYIIGATEYLNETNSGIYIKIGEKKITLEDYKKQIDNLILYYLDKSEYFPACNLLFMKGDVKEATEILLQGINNSLEKLDFRMIRHYCRLAKTLELLDEFTTRRITNTIENYITRYKISPERLNECIVHYGEIHNILLESGNNQVTFNLNIRTNVQKNDVHGISYINSLANHLNRTLSEKNIGQQGFRVAVSSHSPFEIAIDIICATGAIATIAQLIWQIVDRHNYKSEPDDLDDYKYVDADIYSKYVDACVDECKEKLLRLKYEYTKKEMNPYIEEITQKLKTDLEELYNQDIMIFKKENKRNNKQ